MRLAQILGDGDLPVLARFEGDAWVPIVAAPPQAGGDPLRAALADGVQLDNAPAIGEPIALGAERWLPAVIAPSKILAIGLNYADHARETGMEPPAAPISFPKYPSSLLPHDGIITWRGADSAEVDYEAELAVVIGRRCRDVSETAALDVVLGYAACNDVSARDAQFSEGQWGRAKSFDTFCPLGPWVVTADEIPDPQSLRIRCHLDGETLQDSSTSKMIFSVAEIVSYLSRFMTLEAGDVIATGTPSGVGFSRTPPVFLRDGMEVEIDIERIGVLRSRVRVT